MNQYYVYMHTDELGKPVYIGMGKGDRAWVTRRSGESERNAWKEEQMSFGRVPSDWVYILERGLAKRDALFLEQEYIMTLRPRFNKCHNPDHSHSKVTSEEVEEWKELRALGKSYKAIGDLSNYTTMTVWRALNGAS